MRIRLRGASPGGKAALEVPDDCTFAQLRYVDSTDVLYDVDVLHQPENEAYLVSMERADPRYLAFPNVFARWYFAEL